MWRRRWGRGEGSILVTRVYGGGGTFGISRFQSPRVIMRPPILDTKHLWSPLNGSGGVCGDFLQEV